MMIMLCLVPTINTDLCGGVRQLAGFNCLLGYLLSLDLFLIFGSISLLRFCTDALTALGRSISFVPFLLGLLPFLCVIMFLSIFALIFSYVISVFPLPLTHIFTLMFTYLWASSVISRLLVPTFFAIRSCTISMLMIFTERFCLATFGANFQYFKFPFTHDGNYITNGEYCQCRL